MLSGTEDRDVNKFLRQRRNLILSILLLIFYMAGELEFTKLNFWGNEIAIKNPNIIDKSLIIIFFYFLWRYYTTLRDTGNLRRILDSYPSGFAKYIYIKAIDKARKISEYSEANIKFISIEEIREGEYTSDGKDILKNGISYQVCFSSPRAKEIDLKDKKVVIKGSLLFWYKVKYWLNIVFRTSSFSEYILPYILSAFAIASIIYKFHLYIK